MPKRTLVGIALAGLALTACGGGAQEAESSMAVSETATAPSETAMPTPESSEKADLVPTVPDVIGWGYSGFEGLAAYECSGADCLEPVAPGVFLQPWQEFGAASAAGTTVDPAECAPLLNLSTPSEEDPIEAATFAVYETPGVAEEGAVGAVVSIIVFEWASIEEASARFQSVLAVPDSCGQFSYFDPRTDSDIAYRGWLDGSPIRDDDAITWVHVDTDMSDTLYIEGRTIGQVNNKTYNVTVRDNANISQDDYLSKAEELLAALPAARDGFRRDLGKP